MRKAIIMVLALIIGIPAFAGRGYSQYSYQPYKNPVALNISIVSDTGKALDSAKKIYPCGKTKYLKALVTVADVLGTDSLVFFTKLPNGRYDTLAFKVQRSDTSQQTILKLPASGSVKIYFMEPWPDYEVDVKHTNQIYNATRKWYVDWIIGYTD